MHAKASQWQASQTSQTERRTLQAQPGLGGQGRAGWDGSAGVLLSLQRSHGNRYVQRFLEATMLRRDCSCGGTCSECGQNAQTEELDRPSLQPKPAETRVLICPKLIVSQPGDPYEQEADRVAEEVMRMPEAATRSVHKASPGRA